MPRLDYSAPGVYVEEVSRGSRPIQGISMSVAGFVGFTEDIRKPAEIYRPTLITNWNQYLDNFAKVGSDGFTDFGAYLPFAVKGWFDNGGGRCWVVSMGATLPFTRTSKNSASRSLSPSPDDHSSLSSDGDNPSESVPSSSEETSSSTSNEEISQCCTEVMTINQRPSLKFFQKPASPCSRRIVVVIQSDEPKEPGAGSDVEMFDTGEYFRIHLECDGELLKKAVLDSNGSHKLDSNGSPIVEDAVYRHLTMGASTKIGYNVVQALAASEHVGVEPIDDLSYPAIARRPINGFHEISCPPPGISNEVFGRRIYGTRKNRSGVQGLFEIDEIAMVACPDLMLAYQRELLTLDEVHGVMEAMIVGCESSAPSPAYRMVVLDTPPVRFSPDSTSKPSEDAVSSPEQQQPEDADTDSSPEQQQPEDEYKPLPPQQQRPQDAEAWLDRFGRRSPFAALYYPWIKVLDPRSGQPKFVPPCGHMMGIWCRTDELRGIHKAPANEVPRGILGLAYETNFREQEFLNPRGINCIRKFRDRGYLVWGARTLAQRNDIDWRYISVRRLMSYLEKSIELGTEWAVFEPNDEDLWARVTRTVRNFLERIWREGALFGATPEEAFYVRCDAELNTPETMKLGLLYIEVGVAPVRPAEFVVFRVSQWDPTQGKAGR
jgi:hypothetical protein